MTDSDTLHEVDSVDEAISVGAEELGVDEDDLRERIENLEFVPTSDSTEGTRMVEGRDD